MPACSRRSSTRCSPRSSQDVERYRAGEKKVVNFLMGQVMKRTQGKANPGAVREILLRKLEG